MEIKPGNPRATIVLRLSLDLKVKRQADAVLGRMSCLENGADETFQSLTELPDLIETTCNNLRNDGDEKEEKA